MRILIASLLIALSSVAYAVQQRPVQDGGSAYVEISSNEWTLVSIMDDKPTTLSYSQSSLMIKKDIEQGVFYVRPKVHFPPQKPYTIFVRTEKGKSYRLLLTHKDVPPQDIRLVDRRAVEDKAAAWEKKDKREKVYMELCVRMANDDMVPGYEMKWEPKLIPLWKEARFELIKEYSGAQFTGQGYKLTNIDSKSLTTTNEEYYEPGVLAVCIDGPNTLLTNESTMVYVIREGAER